MNIDLVLVLQMSTPIILAAIGESIVQKSGVIQIGLEGNLLMGAFFGFLIGQAADSVWMGMAAALAIGAMFSLIFGVFAVTLRADQVVAGTALTLVALGATSTLYRGRFGESGELVSFGGFPAFFGIDLWMVLTSVLAIFTFGILFRTRLGLAIRAAGEYPPSASAAGYSVSRLRYQALAAGGALAGLGGGYLSLGVAQSVSENMTAGRGFIAIAMVTFGRWNPLFIVPACLLIGYLDSLQFVLQSKGSSVPYQLLLALPYAAALAVLVVSGKGASAPAALGIPETEVR